MSTAVAAPGVFTPSTPALGITVAGVPGTPVAGVPRPIGVPGSYVAARPASVAGSYVPAAPSYVAAAPVGGALVVPPSYPPVFTAPPPAIPMMTTPGSSYVAGAQPYATPRAPSFNVPPPVSMTAGLLDPAKLEAERMAYEKALAIQLDKQVKAIEQEAVIKKQMLARAAERQKAQTALQLEEQLKMAKLQADKEASEVVIGLKEAAIQRRTTKDEEFAIAVAQFHGKRAMEVMSAKSYELQKQWSDKEGKLMAELNQVAGGASAREPWAAGILSAGAMTPLVPMAPQLVPQAPQVQNLQLSASVPKAALTGTQAFMMATPQATPRGGSYVARPLAPAPAGYTAEAWNARLRQAST